MNDQKRERIVSTIMERAQAELLRRREPLSFGLRLLRDVERRSRPLAAVAAAIALVSTLAMMWFGLSVDSVEAQVPTLAEALAPSAFTEWIVSGENPAVSSLMLELEEGLQP